MNVPRSLILSRPDALGDAVVTLSTAGWIKHLSPNTRIIALVKEYTRPVWAHCEHIDSIVTLESLSGGPAVQQLRDLNTDAIVHVFPHREVAQWAKRAAIPRRIGTSHRWWHWITCNERVDFSRKNSDLHEAHLNIKLLAPFGIAVPKLADLTQHIGLRRPEVPAEIAAMLAPDRKHVILHPLLGSGVGWGFNNFAALIHALDPQRWQVFVTGTAAEAERYRAELPLHLPHVVDMGGHLSLEQLMALIGTSDALVAASTGPLHIAAALGIRAIGLYSMRRPIHPGRWAPMGRDAHALVNDPDCPVCAAGKPCDCITRIDPRRVLDLLEALR
ncbi:MAG: glycosyltransferase family 9 protein [Flavobacteriales bacterium]